MLTNFSRLTVFILILSSIFAFGQTAPPAYAASGSITTTFAHDNGADGAMFDLLPLTDLTITGFDLNCCTNIATGNPVSALIYYKTGTYVGSESTAGNWTLHQTVTFNNAGVGNPSNVPINPLNLLNGQTYGLYITLDSAASTAGSFRYTTGANNYSNSELQLTLGTGITYLFGTIFSPRTWNGTIYYDFGTTPTNTPVPPTDTPTDTAIPPTDTATNVPPTDTPTDTAIPPTDTATNVPPTNTPTSTATLVIPTITPSITLTTCVRVAVAPSLTSPVHRSHTTDTTPSFSWSSVTGAQSYRLMVYLEDRSFEYKKRVFVTNYTLTAAEALTPAKYLWRVRTQDIACSTWTTWSTRNTLFID